jgi:hypothetical protein
MANPTPRDDKNRIDIDAPAEGFATLAARFTGEMMKRVTEQVTRMKASGMPEQRIITKLRSDLRHLDERSLRLVYNKALGGTTDDTWKAEELKRTQEVKPGTLEVDPAALGNDISIGSVVQFKGELHTVTRLTKTGLVIKKLL